VDTAYEYRWRGEIFDNPMRLTVNRAEHPWSAELLHSTPQTEDALKDEGHQMSGMRER